MDRYVCGQGDKPAPLPTATVDSLSHNMLERNLNLIESLRESEWSEDLHQAAINDSKLGYMTEPADISSIDLSNVLLSPRFGVREMKDGNERTRPIDN